MRYFIILLLSIALLIGLECREHKQNIAKATAETTASVIESAQQHQVQTNEERQTISDFSSRVIDSAKAVGGAVPGFGSKVVNGIKSFELPGGGKVSFIEGTFGDKFTSFLGINSTKVGERFIFDDLIFSTGSANLSAESLKEVAELAKVLKAFPKVHINIEGHTDALGDPAKNIALSLARANAVKNQLVRSSINANRITTQGLGSAKPANESDPKARENRRIEIVLTKR